MSPSRSSSRSQKETRSDSNASRSSGVKGSPRYDLSCIRFPFCKPALSVPGSRVRRLRGRAARIGPSIEKGDAAFRRVETRNSRFLQALGWLCLLVNGAFQLVFRVAEGEKRSPVGFVDPGQT